MNFENIKVKDPNATLDFYFTWKPVTHGEFRATKDWLEEDETILSFLLTGQTGITLETAGKYAQIQSDGKITFWLSGGTAKVKYPITCRITTSKDRIDERTMWILVKER